MTFNEFLQDERGTITDLLVLIFFLFFLTVLGVTAVYINNSFFNKLSSTRIVTDNPAIQSEVSSISSSMTVNYNTFMNLVPFLLVMMFVSMLILAYYTPTNPIFLPISLIIWLIFTYLSFHFANFLYEFISYGAFATIMNQYPLFVSIIKNLPFIVGIGGFALLVVIYSKRGVSYEAT